MRPHIRQIATATLSAALLLGSLANCAKAPAPHSTPTPKKKFTAPLTDFNGDGYADLAIGATGTTVGGKKNAGAVVIAYGGPHGLDRAHRTVLTPDSPGIPGAPRTDGAFGYRTAAGDLDHDGCTDLVVAARWPTPRVTVMWGGAKGLTGGTAVPRPAGDPVDDEHRTVFGQGLAIGDFDGDRQPELAVATSDFAMEREHIWIYEGFTRSGAVRAPYERKVVYWAYSAVHGLSAADLNGDGTSDLALATRMTDSPGGGSFNVFYAGSASGLARGRLLKNVEGDAQAIGDVDGDGYGDLAVGHSNGGYVTRGRVTVIYGSPKGFGKGRADQVIEPRTLGERKSTVPSTHHPSGFGTAVALGDADGDGYADLAVGDVPEETWGSARKPGTVVVLRGSAKGLVTRESLTFRQPADGPAGDEDLFGSAVALTDIDKDGKADLLVSAPGADSGAGAVWSLRGTAKGLTTTGALRLGPTDLGLPGQDTGLGSTLTG